MSYKLRRIGLVLCMAATLIAPATHGAELGESPPRLNGTFLQLLARDSGRTEREWSILFESFRQLSLSQLVVQWSVYDDIAFYPTRALPTIENPPLRTILDLAQASGIKVLVGLAYEPRFYREVQGDTGSLAIYLGDLALRSVALARDLAPLVQDHPAFAGWYVPQEVDDVNWREPARRLLLFRYMNEVSRALLALTPGVSVAVSGFSNGAMDPRAFESFWNELLAQASDVQTVLFQDGVGAKKLDLQEVSIYNAAIRRAVENQRREVIAIVELFEQVGGPPIDNGEFRAVPAPLDRIVQQIAIAHASATPTVLAFSVPEYLSPLGGDAANALFREYRERCVQGSCGEGQSAPTQ